MALLSAPETRNIEEWYADSGASQHMSDQLWMFTVYVPIVPGNWPVNGIGNNVPLQVYGQGNIPIKTKVNGNWNEGTLKYVIYVPNLGVNLFSIRSAVGSNSN